MTKRNLYEERITIWRAASFEQAVELAERDAREYAVENAEYIGLSQVFHVFPNRLASGAEVFSLLRESNYSPRNYLDRYFDTGDERHGDMPCEQRHDLRCPRRP